MLVANDLKKIGKEDLQVLVDNKIAENKELEYKYYTFPDGKMARLPEKQKEKLVKCQTAHCGR